MQQANYDAKAAQPAGPAGYLAPARATTVAIAADGAQSVRLA